MASKLALLLAVPLLGCSNDRAAPDPCADTAQLEMAPFAEVDLIATITYDELVEVDEDGGAQKSTILVADFADLSGHDIITAVTPFDHSCVGMVGLPTSSGKVIPLEVDTIVVESPHIGETEIAKNESGRYFAGYQGDFFTDSGKEEIRVTVESSGDAGSFPGFTSTLAAPPALENPTAAVTESGSLEVAWQSGDSTYMEVVLRSIAENDDALENRVRCYFLADDGCFVVPSSAMEWLLSGGADRIKVRMERHTLRISKPAENAISEIDAMRSIEFNINI